MRELNFDGIEATAAEKRVLFLGYDETETGLPHVLAVSGCAVTHTADPLSNGDDLGAFDLAVSFGYRHIIGGDTLAAAGCPFLNLHIGYLPYNRGAHPNFWAHADGTPSGVTIHLIDAGVDTGDILFQRYTNFAPDEDTFAKTHARLIADIEGLFEENLATILAGTATPRPQRGTGTSHKSSDLPETFAGWETNIQDEIARLDALGVTAKQDKRALIDEIESVRRNNNVNWMDLLRLAFDKAPDEARGIVRKINADDNRISELFKKLGE